MGHPLENTFAEENKHCLVCHHEDAVAVYHAAADLEGTELVPNGLLQEKIDIFYG